MFVFNKYSLFLGAFGFGACVVGYLVYNTFFVTTEKPLIEAFDDDERLVKPFYENDECSSMYDEDDYDNNGYSSCDEIEMLEMSEID